MSYCRVCIKMIGMCTCVPIHFPPFFPVQAHRELLFRRAPLLNVIPMDLSFSPPTSLPSVSSHISSFLLHLSFISVRHSSAAAVASRGPTGASPSPKVDAQTKGQGCLSAPFLPSLPSPRLAGKKSHNHRMGPARTDFLRKPFYGVFW